jgi:thymidylate synthase (FAD)
MTVEVHDNGFVRLDSWMADDISVVNSARVSFGRHKTKMDNTDEGLIKFLMRERHGTPFEHNSFRFHVRCPIFVAREWFRHRIGSFNEFSARYTEMPHEAYLPDLDYMRTQIGKPGAYSFDQLDPMKADIAREVINVSYQLSFDAYERLIASGVAKEIARVVLPVGTYTEFYWTVNARSLMNFLSLRTAETAQREIRDYADLCEKYFAIHMPVTYRAWVEFGKQCP